MPWGGMMGWGGGGVGMVFGVLFMLVFWGPRTSVTRADVPRREA
jgi:hypothetical protein